MKKLVITSTLALLVGAATLIAQDSPDRSDRPDRPGREGRGPRPGGPGAPEGRGPGSPLMFIFDANKDGVIDATEIENASAALKKLDTNSDGKLTPDELRPQRPGRGPRSAE